MTKEEIEAAVMAVLMRPPNTRTIYDWDWDENRGGYPDQPLGILIWVPARATRPGRYVPFADFDAKEFAG